MLGMSEMREMLIRRLIEEGVLTQPEVIKAMSKVPREEFVMPELREQAYMDTPLPSLEGQTISAPHMVAIMCQLLSLKPGHMVLEVGAGTGYHAAVCAEIVAPRQPGAKDGHVFAIERIRSLVEFARSNLARCGYSDRVTVIEGDGTLGYPDAAPYDAILVTAAAPRIPPPLKSQLRDGGRMVIPVGEAYSIQDLIVVEKSGSDFKEWTYGGCVFVPLCGRYGWRP
ncbi:MAG: Protein-L-isoaspartate O-methyltransferase [Candidatus Methanosuratincola subterraneus]|uniref:Protein-L-isoaspartate O-methyltransferase n=1 Tax=Methanosuratincola subterraneus TaxID=2593994 RepID=A0A3S3SQZ4_METS7|nr:MAG: Protein-L-isoaspartate O-methyltransferase [Candidatus Methanosuratincola subterraneus]